jgi:hypothetical protein
LTTYQRVHMYVYVLVDVSTCVCVYYSIYSQESMELCLVSLCVQHVKKYYQIVLCVMMLITINCIRY